MFFWANVYRHAVRLLSRACYSYFTWLTGVKVCATVAGTQGSEPREREYVCDMPRT